MNSRPKTEEKKEKEREMKTIVKASVFAATLGLACLLPATAHAQAEVAPDTYEITSNETVVAQPVQTASNSTTPADFQGRFSLPYDVRCSGKSLKSGQYSLSVKSEGTSRVVTIVHNGEAMKIRAQEMPGRPATSHSALLVRKSPDGRLLEAVYVQQLNTLLFLDSNAAAQSGRMERLPIS